MRLGCLLLSALIVIAIQAAVSTHFDREFFGEGLLSGLFGYGSLALLGVFQKSMFRLFGCLVSGIGLFAMLTIFLTGIKH
jgi:hypothetical protein